MWTTIAYRSVALLVLAFAAVAFISVRLVFPQFTRNTLEKASDVTSTVLERVDGMAPATRARVISGQRVHLEKAKQIVPPTSVAPVNIAPLFSSGALTRDVEFSSRPMRNAVGYRLRISRNPYFSSTLVDKKVNTAAVTVMNLGEGVYYWMLQSYDAKEKESVRSQKNRCNMISTDTAEALNLELDPFIQHGHLIKVTGKTQKGARVMVNGSEVPLVNSDG